MNELHYQRLDKGIKRLKVSEVEREARQQARSRKGTFLPIETSEKRSEVILEACEGLKNGSPTPEEVAKKHNIPRSTVYSWLLADPRASEARAVFFGERLGFHLEGIESSDDPLDLARAREAYRAWADIAAKRDPQNYGIKQEVTHELGQSFTHALLEISKRREEKLLTANPQNNPQATTIEGKSEEVPDS